MTRVAAKLYAAYFNDLLDDDVEAFLGAAAGPTGLAGSRPQPPRRRSLRQLLGIASPRDDAAPTSELGDVAPGAGVTMLQRAVHMRRALDTLVGMASRRGDPGPELDAAISGADLLRAREVRESTVDLAHLRRIAMATLELMDQLAVEDDQPLPEFEPQNPAPSRWSA